MEHYIWKLSIGYIHRRHNVKSELMSNGALYRLYKFLVEIKLWKTMQEPEMFDSPNRNFLAPLVRS